jgi:glycosyltransferase involved in cell wall biosynthesis
VAGTGGPEEVVIHPAPVSVVVPTYNRAHCLPDTINSVLGQTVQPIEVLVVDDGSRDDTREVVERFPAPVRYVWRENGGSAAARNTGIRESRGEYVAFLDADDVWESTKLEVQLALHAAHPHIGWSITGHLTTDGAGEPLPGAQGFTRDFPAFTETGLAPETFFGRTMVRSELPAAGARHVVYTGDAYPLMFDGNFAFPSCVMMRRSLAAVAGMFDEALRCAVDTEYFHRLAAAAPLGVILTPLFRWRRGETETIVSSGNMVRLVETALLSLDRAVTLRGEPDHAVLSRYRVGKRRLLLRLAYMHLTELNRPAARAVLQRAWREGAPVSSRSLAIYSASLMPAALLRALQRVKRWPSR